MVTAIFIKGGGASLGFPRFLPALSKVELRGGGFTPPPIKQVTWRADTIHSSRRRFDEEAGAPLRTAVEVALSDSSRAFVFS